MYHLLIHLNSGTYGGNHDYWWMSNPGVFSSGNENQQQQQNHQSSNRNYESQGNSLF